MSTLPAGFAKLIVPFACLFSKRVFQSVQVLLAGAILATGKRTVTSVLCVMGLSQERHFGSYKADNRLVYFDINDFDESALAPCTWDIVRLLTSIQCGADALSATAAQALAVGHDCLNSYRDALIRGKSLWVEPETSSGLVRDLFEALQKRSRSEFLDGRTLRKNDHRRLKVDDVKALPVDEVQRRGAGDPRGKQQAEADHR